MFEAESEDEGSESPTTTVAQRMRATTEKRIPRRLHPKSVPLGSPKTTRQRAAWPHWELPLETAFDPFQPENQNPFQPESHVTEALPMSTPPQQEDTEQNEALDVCKALIGFEEDWGVNPITEIFDISKSVNRDAGTQFGTNVPTPAGQTRMGPHSHKC